MKKLILSIIVCSILCIPLKAVQLPVPALECWMKVGDGEVVKWNPAGSVISETEFDFSHATNSVMKGLGEMWEIEATIFADPDPYVTSNTAILNSSGATQTYTFTVVLPVSPALAAPTLYGGTTIATLLDADGDGSATMTQDTVSGQSLYTGMIDMVGVLSLLPPDTGTLTVNSAGGIASASKIVPISMPGGAVNMTIGIQHKFTLTAGDSATFNSRFEVIPEPMTVALLGLGGLVLIRRRR